MYSQAVHSRGRLCHTSFAKLEKNLLSLICVQSGKMATTPAPSRFSLSSALRWLRPSHEHTALSATLLLMSTVMLSRVVGFLRETYVSNTFGADPRTDAFFAAFTIPDWLNYLVAGGTVSITFI